MILQLKVFGFGIEVSAQPVFGKNHIDRKKSLWIISGHLHIRYLFAYRQPIIGWKCPWRGSPCQEITIVSSLYFTLGSNGGAFYHLVTTRLVKLMRTQTSSGC